MIKRKICKECGAAIVRIDTVHGIRVCDADPVTYWRSSHPDTSILTPNGETIYCVLEGESEDAHGIGYTLHTCFEPMNDIPAVADTGGSHD